MSRHALVGAREAPATALRRVGSSGLVVQTQLAVRAPCDVLEQEAERVAAAAVGGGLAPGNLDELAQGLGGLAHQRQAATARPLEPHVERAIDGLRGAGRPLEAGVRRDFESRLGHDFGRVRVHAGEPAADAADALGANAFTVGADVVFGRGRYAPSSEQGRRLLVHELTHVVQQSAAGPLAPAVQRDLAVLPANPGAVAPALTPAELAAAVRFNRFRFQDPFTVRLIRDVLGLEPFPAVADEDFANAIAQWQVENNLTPDAKAGAETTATLVAELAAEGQPDAVTQLRVDNFVSTTDVTPQTFRVDTGAPIQHFVWEVGFRTSLRNGFIIQQVDNDFVPAMCNGTAYTAWRPTPRYWEAWSVDGAGRVTPNIGAINDQWTRPFRPRSSGRWTMRGRLFTTLRLPATFVVGGVPDAGPLLRSTLTNPGGDFLGLDAGSRRVGGRWDFCPPSNTHVRT